ncbi:dermonecrotic toxin domain-containing protein [Pseudomonas sp. LF245]
MPLSVRNIAPAPQYVIESFAGDVPANLPIYTTQRDPRVEGDQELAHSIGPAPFHHPPSGPNSVFDIPPESTLGVWLNQLDSALRHPDFQRWMKDRNVSPSTVRFDPSNNTLHVFINSQPQQFSLEDDSGFAAVAGPLIQAVRTLGFWPPSSGRFLDYPHKPYNVAHFHDVLRFYAINPSAPPDGLQSFNSISRTDPQRGDTALAEQQRIVGDIHDRHTLLGHLTRLRAKLPTAVAPEVLARDLSALKIDVHPGSTFAQAHPGAFQPKVSAAHFITASGAALPKTLEALQGMIRTLRDSPLEQARAQREKNRYTALLRKTHTALPKVREEAKKWAEGIIFKLTGNHVDADTVYLNRFQGGGNTATTLNGWEWTIQEPWRSQKLPDALLSNFSEDDWLPGNLDSQSGLYTVGAGQSTKGGYGAHNQFPLLPSDVMHAAWKTDFQGLISQKQKTFWQDHGEDYRASLKGEFVSQARQQLKAYALAGKTLPAEHRFTRDDYHLVMKAVANLPLDENQPLTLEQLRHSAPVKGVVRAHLLDINGRASTDILRFSAADHTTQILYVPGHAPAFLRFASIVELDEWVKAQGSDPDKRKALASHFSLRDRQDEDVGFWSDFASFISGDRHSRKGVDSALKYLGNDYWSHQEGVVIDSGRLLIEADVFSVINNTTRRRMTGDADVVIKSNSEVTRDTWLNDLTAAAGLMANFALIGEPIVVGAAVAVGVAQTALGTEKAVSGDTQAERQQGASSALDGALNTLFSLGGGIAEEEVFEAPITQPLRQEVFADGRQAQVLDHPVSDSAYTLPRSNGYDLVDGDTVYRYQNAKPGELTELKSGYTAAPLEDVEAICPAPATGSRVRRGINAECFAKLIADLPGDAAQLQALEHVRLFPAKVGLFNKERQVVYEKRLYKMIDGETGAQLIPVARTEPITYKNRIRGALVKEPGFGFSSGEPTGPFAQQTRVVKLNKISNVSDDQRQLRGVVITREARQYLVIEADTAEFYFAPLGKAHMGELTFHKCSVRDLPMVQDYRAFMSLYKGAQSLDAELVALPTLKEAYSQLEKAGYAKADLDQLKQACKGMTDEQQREVVYQLQRASAIRAPDIALRPNKVLPLEKPADFSSWPTKQQNQFYAEKAKASVDQALTITGLGPGNLVRSPADLARADAAHMTREWLLRTANLRAPNAGDLIMKTGAGNCGEMALLSKDIINKSGGRAYEWGAGDAHSFTVVGGPSGGVSGTVDFAEAAWADAWIVDPWAGIACPAAEYTQQLKNTLVAWDKAGLKIRSGTNANMNPLDPEWLDTLIDQPKRPYGLPRPPTSAAPHFVAMGESTTLSEGNAALSTRSLSDCSALAVLTDWNGSIYQTRTLMHLTGSNLEFGLLDGSTRRVLDTLQDSLKNGGKVILVGGVDTQSTQGMATVIGQTFHGQQPLKALLEERPGVSVSIASSSGVQVNADGTFTLIDGTGKGVFSAAMVKQIFERID